MQLELIILSKSERERQIPYDVTYICNLKYDTSDLSMKQNQNHRYREQTGDCQEERGLGKDGMGDEG